MDSNKQLESQLIENCAGDCDSSDQEPIARVNGTEIYANDLLRFLRLSLNWQIRAELIAGTLAEQEFEKRQLEIGESELEEAVNAFRAKLGLLTAAETEKWLDARDLTADDLYEHCEFELKLEQLKKELFCTEKLKENFVFSRAAYERVEFYQLLVKNESKAKELAALIKDGKSFFELARKHSQDEETRKLCGYAGLQNRASMQPELESRIYAAGEGDLIGPIKSLGSYYLILIEKFHAAELNPALETEIRNKLFAEWQQDLLARSEIEILA